VVVVVMRHISGSFSYFLHHHYLLLLLFLLLVHPLTFDHGNCQWSTELVINQSLRFISDIKLFAGKGDGICVNSKSSSSSSSDDS